MGIAVGIDLGTTNTVVAAVKNGVATTLADLEGNRLIPSVVAFHPNGTVQVGWPALERRIIDPENTVYSVKRLIGRSFQSAEVQQQKPRFPFKLVEGPKGATLVETRAESYALPEISAFVLRRAKAIAEAALGETVDAAVITVPANFDDPQRASTKMAGKLAGLEVLRILNEPTAAALAYGRSPDASERLCVYDLGGGTFDVTMLDVSSGVFEVLSTAGDTSLGGDDIDAIIVDRMANMAMRTLNVDPRNNPNAVARMRVAAEALKKELSFKNDASVEVPDIGRGEEGVPLTLKCRMSRDDLERLSQPIVDKTVSVTRQAMKNASVEASAFDRVILVGGATRMPMVVRQVQDLFQKKVDQRINPDEVVALGAAIQAYTLGARKARGKKPPPAGGEGRTTHGTGGTYVPRPSGQVNIPKELEQAVAMSKGGTMHGIAPAPPAAPASIAPKAAEGTEAKAEDPTAVHKRPTRPKMRKVGDVREIPAKRYDPRAEPEDDEPAPPSQRAITTKPPPAAPSTPRALPDLPPTRPNMHAVTADQEARAAARGASLKQDEPDTLTFARPPSQLSWPSGAPGQVSSDDAEELDLPRPPPMPKPARHPPPVPPPPAPALPGDRISGTAPKPATQHPPWRAPSAEPSDELAPDESLLIDVTPLSLRVETVGGYSDVLIAANSQVPCDRTRVFSTAADDQTQVFIRVAQGESPMFRGNTFLGELELSGLVPMPRGEAQIAVTFEIDADGILAVFAKDGRTGKETHAKMHVFGAQTETGDLERMMHRQNQRKVV